MSNDHPRLIDLAGAVADGAPVDWPAAESGTSSGADRDLVRGLQLLERIAEVHGGVADPQLTARAPGPAEATGPPQPTHWGPLRLIERIGRGAFGEVYRAWDSRLDREVALKLLAPAGTQPLAAETLPESTIVDEGRLLARVRHPGVVTVFGADRIDERTGVWMELVPGRTLAAEVRERGPLPPHEIEQIGTALADALAAVHRAGLIHRDVKAQNVMRDPSGRVVLMDFGTGLEFAETAETVALAGTPLYLAPEVINGGSPTWQSDVYGLGVVLFHLATGGFPVEGRTLREVRRAHARGERRTLAAAGPNLPRALVRVIDRALAPEPERFADAQAMAAALADIDRSAGRRRRVAIAATVAVGTVAVVAAIVQFGNWWPADPFGGRAWVQVPEEVRLKANIRGPSVDGRWAPCTSPWGSRNVALCHLADGSVRVLRESANPARLGQPAGKALVSPDGRQVAYVWSGEPNPRSTTVNVIGIDGRGQRELYASTAGLALEQWTWDGRALIVRDGGNTGSHRVLQVPVEGGEPRVLWRLTRADFRVALSPDETRLVIERQAGPGNTDLVAVDLTSGQEAWRYEAPTNDVSPVWLPDGGGVVFVSDPEGCRQIVKLVPGERASTLVPERLHDIGGPQAATLLGFGAAGTIMVTSTERLRTAFEAAIDLDRARLGAPRPLPASCTDVTVSADWSPDGSRVAYMKGAGTQDRATTVVVANPDRVEREYSVPGIYRGLSRVRWSPDGRSLLVTTSSPDLVGLLNIIDVASGDAREIARTGAPDRELRFPQWARDGRAIYYREQGIWRTDLTSGEPTLMFRPGAPSSLPGPLQFDAAFDIAPDGALLLGMGQPDGPCTVRIRQPDGREVDRHTLDAPCLGATWTRDGARLIVGTTDALWLLDREAGDPQRLLSNRRGFWDVVLHPDGRRVLFTLGSGPPNFAQLGNIPGVIEPRPVRVSMPARWETIKTPEPLEVAISGRVTDADGRPVARVYVNAHRRTVENGVTRFTTDALAALETDADGRYRLPGRQAGDYVVLAAVYISPIPETVERRVPPPIPGPGGVQFGYVSTPHRARDDAARAPRVVHADAPEVTGIDIQLERQPVFELRGRVEAPPGQALPLAVYARRLDSDPEMPPTGRRMLLRNGRFSMPDVPEGRYEIVLEVGALRGEAQFIVAGRPPEPVTIRLLPK